MGKKQALTPTMIADFHNDFVSRETANVISRSVMKNGINASSEDQQVSQRLNRVFFT